MLQSTNQHRFTHTFEKCLLHLRHHEHEVKEDVVGDFFFLAQLEQRADVVLALLLRLGVDFALGRALLVVSPIVKSNPAQ